MWLVNYHKLKKKPLVKWLAQYQQIVAILKTKGIDKPETMPANKFSKMVITRFPKLTDNFIAYTDCFEALMYQELTLKQKEQYIINMSDYQQQLKKQLKLIQKI